MPGHKRELKLFDKSYSIDITEIDSFDNLHHPAEIIKDNLLHISQLYGSDRSYVMINGSTGGILSAISSCCGPMDKILIARNCHKSVYNAVFLKMLEPIYIYPEIDEMTGICLSINCDEIEKTLEKEQDIKAVVITSPTYEGIVSDIKKISHICHLYGIPLIVDEAHGAHFSFGDCFPKSALGYGADIVIQSLHKTLPALTQTAILHVKSEYVDNHKLEFFLQTFQTSSPSYILMSSAFESINYMASADKNDVVKSYYSKLTNLREQINSLKNIYLFDSKTKGVFDYDNSKLIICHKHLSGDKVMSLLREKYKCELEMSSLKYAIAMTSIADSDIGYQKLLDALREIDNMTSLDNENKSLSISYPRTSQALSPYKASTKIARSFTYNDAIGRISSETLYLYPPGIPFIVSGEVVTEEIADLLNSIENNDFSLKGIVHKSGYINCI
ncbi:MAG: aminotransferase class I/II-fold pyridoxal phosphate-dependent enzyme [Clostridia bacterium]|nr:aminotransferase class I/II-fold pyridoxal phosphate-dependent enzyme [Clostridia bacterium]